jgi:hypothetical protein
VRLKLLLSLLWVTVAAATSGTARTLTPARAWAASLTLPIKSASARLSCNQKAALSRAFVVAGGGMWTHFPDRLAYRFTEACQLELR